MDNEIEDRLEYIEAETHRIHGELAALQNVLVGALRDTFIAKPDVVERMLVSLQVEIDRLDDLVKPIPAQSFMKEGAQRFYKKFSALVRDSIGIGN